MADSTQLEEPWGQLVVIEGKADVDRFPFSCAEIQIGRGKGVKKMAIIKCMHTIDIFESNL